MKKIRGNITKFGHINLDKLVDDLKDEFVIEDREGFFKAESKDGFFSFSVEYKKDVRGWMYRCDFPGGRTEALTYLPLEHKDFVITSALALTERVMRREFFRFSVPKFLIIGALALLFGNFIGSLTGVPGDFFVGCCAVPLSLGYFLYGMEYKDYLHIITSIIWIFFSVSNLV